MTDKDFIPTIGVTGFGRCGSTMVMAMLKAGGVPPVIGSDSRSYELSDLGGLWAMADEFIRGRSVKLLDSAAYLEVPLADEWRFVWIDRDPGQQAKSLVKFARRLLGVDIPDAEGAVKRFAASYASDRASTLNLYRAAGKVLVLKYEAVLADPLKAARALRRLVPHLDVMAGAAVVHRRSPDCRPDLSFELTGVCS